MKIAINLLRFSPNVNIGGNYTYSYNIINGLISHTNENGNIYYLLVTKENKKMFDFEHPNIKFIFGESKNNIISQLIYENYFIRKILKNNKFDLFYSPNFLLPFFKLKLPTVATIHDINFMHFSQGKLKDIYKHIIYRKTLKNATGITTVSNFTKEDVCKHFGNFEYKIKVVYNGCNYLNELKNNIDKDAFKKAYNINKEYILAISHYKHKNAQLAIKAFSYAKPNLKKDFKLIITGAKGQLKQNLIDIARSHAVLNDVIFIDFVKNEYMKSMYAGASLFLFPSIFEGFGLPVIEAMSMGCPVIASDRASIPEVVGNAGILLDINSPEVWGRNIVKILNDSNFKESLISKGYEQAKKFDWNYSAKILLEVFAESYRNFYEN